MAEPLVTDEDREKAAALLWGTTAASRERTEAIAAALAAERRAAVLQERTQQWHEAGPDSPIAWRSLPEHLGMTIAEYNRWVEGTPPAALPE